MSNGGFKIKKARFGFEQYTSGIIVPLLILAIGAIIYFVLIPKYKEAKAVAAALRAKRTAIQIQEDSLSSVKSLVTDFKKKESQLLVVDEALPGAPRIPELLANLDHLSKQSGLLISTLQITPAATLATVRAGEAVGTIKRTEELLRQAENLSILDITIGLVGKYPNLKSYLANLEKNLRIMDIESMTFGSTEVESGLQEYSLKIQTYYQKQ